MGILVKKFCPGIGGGAFFTLKNWLNVQFFSKNMLFYEKFVPEGGEFGKKSWPGGGEFGQIFWPGVPNPHPCPMETMEITQRIIGKTDLILHLVFNSKKSAGIFQIYKPHPRAFI